MTRSCASTASNRYVFYRALTAIAGFAPAVAVTIGPSPDAASPVASHVQAFRLVGAESEATTLWLSLTGVTKDSRPDGERAVVVDLDLIGLRGNEQNRKQSNRPHCDGLRELCRRRGWTLLLCPH